MTDQKPDTGAQGGLARLRVVAFESRRREEMGALIRRHGGEPVVVPAMREIPIQDNEELLRYLTRLKAGEIDVVILMTGVGLRTLLRSVETAWSREQVAEALRSATLIARGPKPVLALREIGLVPDHTVAEPNTYREILETIDAHVPVRDKVVAVQEYGIANADFLNGLEERGARVDRISIYRWALPEDLEPLRTAIVDIANGRFAAALFTSATQVYHVFEVAGSDAERLRSGLRNLAVGSIGPVCSAALNEHGVSPDFEPNHPKMGHLVLDAAQRTADLVQEKRRTRP